MVIWPGCQHSWRTGATISLQKYPIPYKDPPPKVQLCRTDVIFTGYDIVPGNVEDHKKKFEGKPWNFEVGKQKNQKCIDCA